MTKRGGVKMRVLNQQKTDVLTVDELHIKNQFNSCYGIEGEKKSGKRILLGVFRMYSTASNVLFNMVEQYNQNPNAICVIPEDDEDITAYRDVLVLPCPTCDESEKL